MIDPNAAKGPKPHPVKITVGMGHGWRLVFALGLALMALFYVWFLCTRGISIASGSDASGYFNSAHLLATGATGSPVKQIPGLQPPDRSYYYQQPLGFVALSESGTLLPTYPVGLPLQLLVAAKLVGWDRAAILVNVLSALGIGWLMILLGRKFCGLEWPWLLTGVALLLGCPLLVFFALQPMSDVSSTFWTLLALFAAAQTRANLRWGWITGFAVGLAVLIRPTNALVLFPVSVLLGAKWRNWLVVVLAGLPFAAIQAVYNLKVYGHALTSGYGDVSHLIQGKFVPHNLAHFAHWIPLLLTPLVLLALGWPWLVRSQTRILVAFGIWFGVLTRFYAFYYHSGETWWYLRFILPIFPALILVAVMVAQKLTDRVRVQMWRTGVIALVAMMGLYQLVRLNRTLDVTAVQHADKAYYDTTRWLQENVPQNAVMAAMQASGALHFYTDFPLVRYDLLAPEEFKRVAEIIQANHQPIYAPLFPFELKQVVDAKLGGTWEKVATIDYITIWRLQP